MEETKTEQEVVINKIADPRIEKAVEGYNESADKMSTAINEAIVFFNDKAKENEFTLMDTLRTMAYTMTRLVSSTYHKTEEEFTSEMQIAEGLVRKFYQETLKEGTDEAQMDNFRISRLMLMATCFVDTTLWKFYLQQSLMEQAEAEAKEGQETEKQS